MKPLRSRQRRHFQDYATIFMGASAYKIFRLLSYLALAIHIFACVFYKIVIEHRSPEDVQSFLDAKGASPDVSPLLLIAINLCWCRPLL